MWSILQEQLLHNLRDTAEALGLRGTSWDQTLAWLLGQLLVTAILIALAAVLYWFASLGLKLILGRIDRLGALHHAIRTGLRYVVALVAIVAVVAQYGGDAALLKGIAQAGVIALGFYVAWILVSRAVEATHERHQIDPSLKQLLRNSLLVLVLVMGSVTVLAQFGFDVWSVIAGLGIVGIAVGFAAQSTLSNFIAGVTLLIERPFRIGDWVRINEQEGKVLKIAFRTTWLRTRDNIFTMLPNDSVASSEIINYSAEGPTRVRIQLGIAYKESAREARQVILPILEAHPKVLKTGDMSPRVAMEGLGDSSINLVVLIWILPEDIDIQPRITAEILENIKEHLDEAGIEIPFPHLQLFIDDAKGLAPLFSPLRVSDEAGPAANSS